MSADNWRICPACKRRTERDRQARFDKAAAAYGKVPAEQYEQLRAEAQKDVSLDQTMREDYELSVDEDGEFSVSYTGSCISCNFRYHFEHSEQCKFGE